MLAAILGLFLSFFPMGSHNEDLFSLTIKDGRLKFSPNHYASIPDRGWKFSPKACEYRNFEDSRITSVKTDKDIIELSSDKSGARIGDFWQIKITQTEFFTTVRFVVRTGPMVWFGYSAIMPVPPLTCRQSVPTPASPGET